jgi:hypothetical protein
MNKLLILLVCALFFAGSFALRKAPKKAVWTPIVYEKPVFIQSQMVRKVEPKCVKYCTNDYCS